MRNLILGENLNQILTKFVGIINPDLPILDQVALENIFYSEGINLCEYPDACLKFIESFNEHSKNDPTFLSQTETIKAQILTLQQDINLAIISKEIFKEYLSFLRNVMNEILIDNISMPYFQTFFPNKINEFKSRFPLASLSGEEMKSKYWEIIHEDVISILLCYVALFYHSEEFKQEVSLFTDEDLSYLIYIEENCENLIFNRNRALPLKILYRSCLLDDLYTCDFNFNEYVEICTNISPPISIPIEKLKLFQKVVTTTVFRQAWNIFLEETLTLHDPAFSTIDEGFELFYKIVDHIMSGEACYYATLLYSHGKSCCGLAFITNTYNSPLELLKCMNLITILHEAAHMYKRQNRCIFGQKISPVSKMIYEKKPTENKAENGFRFEIALFGILHERFYKRTAKFIINLKSWNSDLNTFQQAIKNLQAGGEQNKEIFRSNRYSQEFLDETSLRCSGYASRFYG